MVWFYTQLNILSNKKCMELYIRKYKSNLQGLFSSYFSSLCSFSQLFLVKRQVSGGIEWQFCAPELFHWNDQKDDDDEGTLWVAI